MGADMIRDEPAALAANGWAFYERCRCAGRMKYKYRNPAHPELELEWWVKYYCFRITYLGRSVKVPPTKIGLLDKTLKEL